MATAPIWLTPAGDLGIIPELDYYELPFDAYDTSGVQLRFSLISGALPEGLELYDDGRVLGIPVVGQVRGVPSAVNKVTTSTFTVRIKNGYNKVADRTFSLTVAGITPPVIVPTSSNLGEYVDGQYADIQLDALEANPLLTAAFSLIGGELPPGLTIDATGRIKGYIRPITVSEGGFDPGFDASAFDVYGFDSIAATESKNFQFTVQAYDGVNYDSETYTIYVFARATLTADTDQITADNDGPPISADVDSKFSPVILTEEGTLGTIRQNQRIAIKIDAEDFDEDPITYAIVSGSLPTGLTLDDSSGYITGLVPYGSLGSITYTFGIRVYKSASPIYVSGTKTFTIKLQGQIDDTVVWNTNADLGIIYSGEISELYVSASTSSSRILSYRLDSIGALPVGLSLLGDGNISGRPSFNLFGLDDGQTIFDGGACTVDRKYTFTISVFDNDNFVSSEKTFSLTVASRNQNPYENLYLQILPERSQKQKYYDVLNNTDIIPANYLYRPQDPWFGKNQLRRVLFQSGLNPDTAADYINAMQLNHYWKNLLFGAVKTARAVDSNFNSLYEVVYIEIIDQQVNDQGIGPNLSSTLSNNSVGVSTIYVNSFPNMAERISENVGYENRSVLPKWMTSRQANGTVLGFTRALIIAYTLPGKSAEVAYRVSQVADIYKLIDFTVDRYEWDSILSDNFLKSPVAGTGNISANINSNVVTGNSTVFTSELIPNNTIYVSNVSIGNVLTVSNATTLIMTTNSISNVTAGIYTHSTNSFILNNFIYASGNINANASSNVITGISTNISGNGTISGNVNSKTITGVNTLFATQLAPGKNLYIAGNSIGIITSITSNTQLIVDTVLGSTLTSAAFTADGSTTLFAREVNVGDTIVVNTNVILGTVKSISSNTNLVLYSNSLSTVSNVAFLHTDRDTYTVPMQGDKYLKFPQIGVLA